MVSRGLFNRDACEVRCFCCAPELNLFHKLFCRLVLHYVQRINLSLYPPGTFVNHYDAIIDIDRPWEGVYIAPALVCRKSSFYKNPPICWGNRQNQQAPEGLRIARRTFR